MPWIFTMLDGKENITVNYSGQYPTEINNLVLQVLSELLKRKIKPVENRDLTGKIEVDKNLRQVLTERAGLRTWEPVFHQFDTTMNQVIKSNISIHLLVAQQTIPMIRLSQTIQRVNIGLEFKIILSYKGANIHNIIELENKI